MRNKLLGAVAAAALTVGLLTAPAGADPVKAKNATNIVLVCDGQTYPAVINGNGEFTAAHIIGSNVNFVPVAFGEITGTAVPSGAPVFADPPVVKGKSGKDRDLRTCTFQTTSPVSPEQAEELGLPAGTTAIQVVGTVTGFFTPARR